MKKYIHLKEVEEQAKEYALNSFNTISANDRIISKNIDEAIEVLIQNNLYYNTRLDILKDVHGNRQETVGEPIEYHDINDICRYVFAPWIRNEAMRIEYFKTQDKKYYY